MATCQKVLTIQIPTGQKSPSQQGALGDLRARITPKRRGRRRRRPPSPRARARPSNPPRAIAPIRGAGASKPQHRMAKVVAQQPGCHGMHECSPNSPPFERVPVRPCIATRIHCCPAPSHGWTWLQGLIEPTALHSNSVHGSWAARHAQMKSAISRDFAIFPTAFDFILSSDVTS